jgi:VanZ family protein
MLRKISFVAFVILLGIIAFATLSPIGLRPKTGHVHLERFLAYALLGGSLSLAFPERIRTALITLICIACGLEFLQTFVATRDGRFPDAMEKSAGAIAGAWLALFGLKLLQSKPADDETKLA